MLFTATALIASWLWPGMLKVNGADWNILQN